LEVLSIKLEAKVAKVARKKQIKAAQKKSVCLNTRTYLKVKFLNKNRWLELKFNEQRIQKEMRRKCWQQVKLVC